MNQAELRLLAEERIGDARALLDGQRWSFAYYTAGYAVECALKSCILARMIHTGWVFKEKWKAQECLTHDLKELSGLAGLTDQLKARCDGNPDFTNRWIRVSSWGVAVRYTSKTQLEAEDLYEAIAQSPDGVLEWLRNYW